MVGDDGPDSSTIICTRRRRFLFARKWEGKWAVGIVEQERIHDRWSSKQKNTSAMHFMHAHNRALAQIWLGWNEKMSVRYVGSLTYVLVIG